MKKLFGFLAIAGLFVTTSCSKTYTCSGSGVPTLDGIEYSENDYTESQLDAIRISCELAGGTWSSN